MENDAINQEFVDIKNQISKAFNIKEEEGSGVVTLTSKGGTELIEISFDCQDETEDFDMYDEQAGEEMEEEPPLGIKFTVSVQKKGTEDKMVFYCVAGENVSIDNVQYVPAGKSVNDETLYSGPIFDRLSDDLRESMLTFLEDRGIDDDMAFFVVAYAENKEQREYVNWLKKLMIFVDKK